MREGGGSNLRKEPTCGPDYNEEMDEDMRHRRRHTEGREGMMVNYNEWSSCCKGMFEVVCKECGWKNGEHQMDCHRGESDAQRYMRLHGTTFCPSCARFTAKRKDREGIARFLFYVRWPAPENNWDGHAVKDRWYEKADEFLHWMEE